MRTTGRRTAACAPPSPEARAGADGDRRPHLPGRPRPGRPGDPAGDHRQARRDRARITTRSRLPPQGDPGFAEVRVRGLPPTDDRARGHGGTWPGSRALRDRKSTRLNSSHVAISYAVFFLKKKTRTDADKKSECTQLADR